MISHRSFYQLAAILALIIFLPSVARENPGKDFYTLTFPAKGKLGQLGAVQDGASYNDKHTIAHMFASANGSVRVPRGTHLYFLAADYVGLSQPLDLLNTIPAGALTSLSLNNNVFQAAELKKLQRFTALRRLELAGSEVTDDNLKILAGMHQLEALVLDRTRVRGRFLINLATHTNMRYLNIGHNDIDRNYLQELKNFPHLERLTLGTVQLRDSDMPTITSCTELKTLDISENPALTDKSIAQLKQLKKLQILLVSSTKITVRGILALKGIPLVRLRILHQQGSEMDFYQLKKAFPDLAIDFDDRATEAFGRQ